MKKHRTKEMKAMWIPMSERKPGNMDDILFLVFPGEQLCGDLYLGFYTKSGGNCWFTEFYEETEFYEHEVSHWMEIPSTCNLNEDI